MFTIREQPHIETHLLLPRITFRHSHGEGEKSICRRKAENGLPYPLLFPVSTSGIRRGRKKGWVTEGKVQTLICLLWPCNILYIPPCARGRGGKNIA